MTARDQAARRDPPSSGARSTREGTAVMEAGRDEPPNWDASHSAGVERRIARALALIRVAELLLVLPAFGVGALLLVGPGPDALGLLCILVGVGLGFDALEETP